MFRNTLTFIWQKLKVRIEYNIMCVLVCVHGNQSWDNPAISSTSFYFLFPSFPFSSDLHIGSPEHSPCLLRRAFHQSSLFCPLLILSSIRVALACNKIYVKLSNDVLTFSHFPLNFVMYLYPNFLCRHPLLHGLCVTGVLHNIMWKLLLKNALLVSIEDHLYSLQSKVHKDLCGPSVHYWINVHMWGTSDLRVPAWRLYCIYS